MVVHNLPKVALFSVNKVQFPCGHISIELCLAHGPHQEDPKAAAEFCGGYKGDLMPVYNRKSPCN